MENISPLWLSERRSVGLGGIDMIPIGLSGVMAVVLDLYLQLAETYEQLDGGEVATLNLSCKRPRKK